MFYEYISETGHWAHNCNQINYVSRHGSVFLQQSAHYTLHAWKENFHSIRLRLNLMRTRLISNHIWIEWNQNARTNSRKCILYDACQLPLNVVHHKRPHAMHVRNPLDAPTKTFKTLKSVCVCASKQTWFPAIVCASCFCQQFGNGFGLHLFWWYTSLAHVCASILRPHSIASNCECRFYCRTYLHIFGCYSEIILIYFHSIIFQFPAIFPPFSISVPKKETDWSVSGSQTAEYMDEVIRPNLSVLLPHKWIKIPHEFPYQRQLWAWYIV